MSGPTRTHTTSFLVPVFGVIWGAAFLHEPVPLGVVGGAVVIGVGLVLVFESSGALQVTGGAVWGSRRTG